MKNFLSFIWEITKIVIIALLIVVPIRYFIFQPFLVRGQSMEPDFQDGNYLIIDEISYRFNEPQRGEVVVFKFPNLPSQRFIKRIIGLPGEVIKIEDGKIIVSKEGESQVLDESKYLPLTETLGDFQISLAEGQYFVLGDNRPSSYDSRRWGVLPKENIIGKVFIKLWPLTALAKVEVPEY
ncbi:MAG: signal peptidase I [Candidatus Nealsonbacteria bacterium CG_4_9_14_0_2_um_filter_37_38]|uniref:Signal peptidase I n=1 Tax=Candidatus Nealsonbacteria bacterium CG_4_10_14_0_8_um_filter_37_14 TaxID=1974684 RepID=A0A2M7R6L3_9BACT|nr:MAG: signal peptidase I [Candidatus Nealsonbacteria bacterium CG11_big_fil_rev_8_21_14_0_20_37_68]PIW92322.1 MAG: signal peptidase I [Candidatus Nealsonbacteria bacterium CG_4_8_14_3_um_filter_37_23]PIY89258.1 MAG: signal peptidase I [Candidatus Nealsonbacteria bacterium CG_4_10_14_0_8_um_filter_37_14]PJC51681.1 MAG: signal peptidase I [Candidatus Nealsonbacteria bacterium CG_4_9_14_0_2_um_filter_37_38]